MSRFPISFGLLSLLVLMGSGCCCPPGGRSMSGLSYSGGYETGHNGGLAQFASCRGACGDVYVDEWLSEPPTPDNCGTPCGGCGSCNQCQPVRSLLRALWGTPYMSNCSTGLCGSSCDSGCSDCDSMGFETSGSYHGPVAHGGHGSSSCNCGQSHSMMSPSIPSAAPTYSAPMSPMPGVKGSSSSGSSQEAVPTPSPTVAPTSAARLNPAARKRAVRTAAGSR